LGDGGKPFKKATFGNLKKKQREEERETKKGEEPKGKRTGEV